MLMLLVPTQMEVSHVHANQVTQETELTVQVNCNLKKIHFSIYIVENIFDNTAV